MSNYNPDDPCTLGPQWFPTVDDARFIDSDSKAIGVALVAATSDSIKELWTMICGVFGSTSNKAGGLVLEGFDITAGLPALGALSESTYYPSSDVYVANTPWTPGAWGPFSGGVVTSGPDKNWRAINSVTLTPATWPNSGQAVANNAFVFNLFGNGYDFSVRFAGVTGTMTGRWVTGVRSHAVVANYWAFDRPGQPVLRPYVLVNGRKFLGPTVPVGDFGTVDYTWPVNPSTGLPWTAADIDRFDTGAGAGDNYSLGWVSQPTGSSNNLLALLQGQLVVLSAAADPRLTIAGMTDLAKQGWQRFTLRDPATAAATSLVLTPGNKYLFLVRRFASVPGADLSIALCATEEPGKFIPGPPTWSSYAPTIDPVSFRPTVLGDESGKAFGVSLVKDDTTVSLDSQPYITTSPLDGPDAWPDIPGGGEYFDNAPVNVNRSMQQRFTTSSSDEYGWLFIMCAQVSTVVDGDLVVRIRRDSDDVQVGGDIVVTSSDLLAPRHRWQKIGKLVPTPPILAAATTYYFDVTSTATAAKGWLVQVLNAGIEPPPKGPPVGTYAATYGGNTDRLTLIVNAVPTDYDDMDAEVTISTLPDPPADFTVTPAGQVCCVNPMNISWTPTLALGCGGFARYEIQKLMYKTGEWRTIGDIDDVNVSIVQDSEAPNNRATSYRMRVFRADGAPSDWTATAIATAVVTNCPGLTFTSNVSPELTVFYQDLGRREFSFPQNIDEFEPMGRDGVIMNREIEDRLTRFKATLRVRDGHVPCLPHGCDDFSALGDDVFIPIKAIARAGLPYVCVKNEAGNVWFGSVVTPTGTWDQHGIEVEGGWAAYTVDIQFVEETNVPAAFNAIATS